MKQHRENGFSLIDLVVVVGLIGIVCSIAVPSVGTAVRANRIKNDARALNNTVSLAKMRASSGFTRVRVRANLAAGSFVMERWDKVTNAWVAEPGTERALNRVQFGFGGLTSPPPSTQGTVTQAPVCRVGSTSSSGEVPATACIVFNSRGLPVDGDGAVFGGSAFYLTDGDVVYATTVTATPRIRFWSAWVGTRIWGELQ